MRAACGKVVRVCRNTRTRIAKNTSNTGICPYPCPYLTLAASHHNVRLMYAFIRHLYGRLWNVLWPSGHHDVLAWDLLLGRRRVRARSHSVLLLLLLCEHWHSLLLLLLLLLRREKVLLLRMGR